MYTTRPIRTVDEIIPDKEYHLKMKKYIATYGEHLFIPHWNLAEEPPAKNDFLVKLIEEIENLEVGT